jgi:hypothetical protein
LSSKHAASFTIFDIINYERTVDSSQSEMRNQYRHHHHHLKGEDDKKPQCRVMNLPLQMMMMAMVK